MTTNGAALILTIAKHRYAATAVRVLAALLVVSGVLYWLMIAQAGEITDIEKTLERSIMFAIGIFFVVSSLKCAKSAAIEGR